MASATNEATTLCFLAQRLAVSQNDVEGTLVRVVFGDPPSLAVQGLLYVFAGLAGSVGIISAANLIVRDRSGPVQVFRKVVTPLGDYLSPHVSVAFSLASLASSLCAELIVVWASLAWRGHILKGYLALHALAWIPLWTGGYIISWGTAVATLSLQDHRQAGLPRVRREQTRFLAPSVFHVVVFAVPAALAAALIATFVVAETTFETALNYLRALLASVVQDTQAQIQAGPTSTTCSISPSNTTRALLLSYENTSARTLAFTRAGFCIWAAAALLLLMFWTPFFYKQSSILRQQIRRAAKLRRRGQRRQRTGSDSYTRFPSKGHEDEEGTRSGSTTAHDAALVYLQGAYQGLIFASWAFGCMVAAYAALAIWGAVQPLSLLQGPSNRAFVLTALSIFSCGALLVNGWSLWRSMAGSPAPTSAASSAPGPLDARAKDLQPSQVYSPPLEPPWVRPRNESTYTAVSRLSA